MVVDELAPIPALAIGYRVTDPGADFRRYLATVLLAEILSNGDASRLHRSLVQSKGLVTDVGAYLGTFGDPLEERDPTRLNITAHYPDRGATDAVLAAVDEELDRLADGRHRTGGVAPCLHPACRPHLPRAGQRDEPWPGVRQVRAAVRRRRR